MGEDGVMLNITNKTLPEEIMRRFSADFKLYDDHFGVGQWELVWVPLIDVEEIGRNLEFECAMGKNALLAKNAGIH